MSGDDAEPENVQNLPSQRDGSWIDFSRRFSRRHLSSIDVTGEMHGASGPTSPLFSSRFNAPHNDYGTVPRARAPLWHSTDPASPAVSHAEIGPGPPGTPSRVSSTSFFHTFRRPKSTYDRVLEESLGVYEETSNYINGIRFYYSTFTSIDWLHDAIKDSTRVLRLRRRKSFRGRILNVLDRSLGWFVVSIVGFLTAILAFCIVRTEQWLFDIKEGYCGRAWYKAKRFCCPLSNASLSSGNVTYPQFPTTYLNKRADPPTCADWVTWAERLNGRHEFPGVEDWIIEYSVYILFALLLAFTSAILTLRFTASNSFIASTDSTSRIEAMRSNSKNESTSEQPKRNIMYFASGSGIPELKCILGGFVMRGYLGGRTLAIKGIGLPLSVASGLTLGKEGPFVHLASCLGNIVSRWFTKYETNEAKRREILSAACAAGVAVAFGAPVGGVLFSLEEMSYYFPPKVMWRSFFCAMIAAATLRFLDPFGTGKLVLFQVTYDKDWHASELWFFILLGLFGGLYGGYMTKAHVWWVKNVRSFKWVQQHPISEVMIITLLTAFLSFLNPYTRMGGVELVYNLFAECHEGEWHEGLCVHQNTPVMPTVNAIAIAGLIKACLVTITFGIKLPAGIFIPTLGVGACAGRIVGLAAQYFERHHPEYKMFDICKGDGNVDCVIPGLYAMIGATAALSGVTRTTISLAVIVFELTRTMNYVVPVMLSVLVAKNVADFVMPAGLYDCIIEMNQLPFLEYTHGYLWGAHTLQDVVNTRVDVIRADLNETVETLQGKLRRVEEDDGGFPVVVKEGDMYKLIGYIGNNELENALTFVEEDPTAVCQFEGPAHMREMTASYSSLLDGGPDRDPYDFTVYMDLSPLTVDSNAPLELVHQIFTKLGARFIIVNNLDGYFEGILDKKAWIAFVSKIPRI